MNYIKNLKINNKRKNKILEQINYFYKTQRNYIKVNKKPSFINRRYKITDDFNVTFKKNLIIIYDIKNRYSFIIRLINRFKFFILEFVKFNLKKPHWFKLNLTSIFSYFFFKLDLFNNSKKILKSSYIQDIFIDNLFNLKKLPINNLNFKNNIEDYFFISSKIKNSYLFNINLLKVKKNYIKSFYYKNFKQLNMIDDDFDTIFKDNLNFLRLYNLFILFILYFIKLFSIYFIKLYFNLWFSYIYMFYQISTKIYILYKDLINSHLIKSLQYRKKPLFNFLFENKDANFFKRDVFSIFSINIKQTNKKFIKREISFFYCKTVSSRGLIVYL